MTKRLTVLALLLAVAAMVAPGTAVAADSWTGEVIDKACFERNGATGPEHADCAKRCFERGGDVGLLTADGDVVVLRAHDDHADVFESVKALAGAQAMIEGEMMEDDMGHSYVVVTAVESATS